MKFRFWTRSFGREECLALVCQTVLLLFSWPLSNNSHGVPMCLLNIFFLYFKLFFNHSLPNNSLVVSFGLSNKLPTQNFKNREKISISPRKVLAYLIWSSPNDAFVIHHFFFFINLSSNVKEEKFFSIRGNSSVH